MDRHAAKGSQPGPTEPQQMNSELTPPFSDGHSVATINSQHQTQAHYVSPQDQSQSPFTPASNATPSGGAHSYVVDMASGNRGLYQRGDRQSSGPVQFAPQASLTSYDGTLTSPSGSNQNQYYQGQLDNSMSTQTFASHPQPLQLDMAHTQLSPNNRASSSQAPGGPYEGPMPAEYQDTTHHPTDVIALDQMAMPSVVPVFGDDGGMNKSPYVGMPEDFMAYLFNSLPSQDSPPGYGLHGVASK